MSTLKRRSSEEDRLSSLPDEILHHIYNFMSAKDALRTVSLSRRLQRAWLSCPNLHFDEIDLPSAFDYENCFFRKLYQNRPFMCLVDRVLFLSKVTNLNSVTLSVRQGCDMTRVESWLYAIISRNVRDLTIYNGQEEKLWFPDRLFRLQSLKRFSFTIFHNHTLHWPHPRTSAATLAALEDLTLCGIKFVNTERCAISSSCPRLKKWKMERCTNLRQLHVNCPILEIFCLEGCKGLRDLVVSGPRLAEINIKDTFIHAGEGTTTTLQISAPNLCKFVWSDRPVHRYNSSKMFPSHATVRFISVGGRDILLSLRETRHLTIDCRSCITEDSLPDSLYRNLEVLQLVVDTSMANFTVAIYESLRCFPNLKILEIRNMKQNETTIMNEQSFKASIASEVQDFNAHQLTPLGHLREVECNDFTGSCWEVHHIRCILGVASQLKMMTITASESGLIHNFSMIVEELQNLPSASPHVNVLFKQPQYLLATSWRPSIINID